ncbi:MAG: hypothetical protein F6J93_34395 [Oscillatoria sp. SIO1A7]|nr:hypothetical protein [Oscillatoria sp. SIO1A7]
MNVSSSLTLLEANKPLSGSQIKLGEENEICLLISTNPPEDISDWLLYYQIGDWATKTSKAIGVDRDFIKNVSWGNTKATLKLNSNILSRLPAPKDSAVKCFFVFGAFVRLKNQDKILANGFFDLLPVIA